LLKKVIKPIEKHLKNLLADLGMPNASVKALLNEKDPGTDGLDQIGILFSANRGIEPEELSKVASGGEFTRLMFAIKYIMAEKVALPTLVFDEVDTGVSGEIANKLGILMQELAKRHQVIAISHLPQIAARGAQHFFVYKDEDKEITASKIRELKEDERILEIAKMIGGDSPSESAFQNAREMVND
jgi:DNA repair protein RecN (Recombination protein N)